MLIALLFLLFGIQQGLNCISIRTTNNKDSELVGLLQKDLQRNNEDYIDKFSSNHPPVAAATDKQGGAGNVAKTNAKDQIVDGLRENPNRMPSGKAANRRNIGLTEENNHNNSLKFETTPTYPTLVVPSINPNRFKVVVSTESSSVASQNTKALSDQLKFIKQEKLSKVKEFMAKNKALIVDFMSKKLEMTTEKMTSEPTTPEPAATRRPRHRPADGARPRARSSEESARAAPAPRQLDMAPARGGRVHSMRIKGRLCHRHVLMPEGPKYDSKGVAYLQRFKRRGRDYPSTKPPKLLLPRCCNCCKKSVLGCE